MDIKETIIKLFGGYTKKEYDKLSLDYGELYNDYQESESDNEIFYKLKEKYKPKPEDCIVTKKFWTAYQDGKQKKALCHNFLQRPDETQEEVLEAFKDTLFGSETDVYVKNNLFNMAFKPVENYRSDTVTYGKSEYWISTQEAIDIMNEVIVKGSIRTYDCEDISILKNLLIPELKMHICKVNGTLHMNNLLWDDKEQCFYIIESTCLPYLQKKNRLQDQYYIEHICAFDENGEFKIKR